MLNPRDLNTTSLIVAVTDHFLPAAYREACIAELAARIDQNSNVARRQPDLVRPPESVTAA
jgi:hypothetical protein